MAVYTDSSADLEEDPTQVADGEAGGVGEQEEGTTTSKVPQTDETRAMIKELAEVVRAQAQPKEEKRVLTAEEKEAYWNVYNPEKQDKDFYRKFFKLNPEATPEEVAQHKELFTAMQNGMMRQAIRGSQVYIQQAIQELLDEHIAPMRDSYSKAEQEGVRTRFYSSYPALQDDRYKKVITTVAKSLANENFPATAAGEQAFHKALAEGAAEFIKMADPSFSLGAQTKQKPGQVPRLPRTTVGGNGNAGGGNKAAQATSKDDFDSIDVDRKTLLKGSL